jgi:hypothetical protein
MKIVLTSKHTKETTNALSIVFKRRLHLLNLRLVSIRYPYSFYNIRESNDLLTINNVSYKIPNQNYNSKNLALQISTLLLNFECVFDLARLRYVFKNNSSDVLKIKFNTSYRIFGFYQGEEYDVLPNDKLESAYIGDINDGLHSLNFISDQLSGMFQYNESDGTRIFATIPIKRTDEKGDMLYKEYYNEFLFKEKVNFDNITINVLDDNLETIYIQNTEWSITLEGDIDYRMIRKDFDINE